MTSAINVAIDSLNQAFSEFKSANDERLIQLEKKGSVDPLLEQRVSKLNDSISLATDRLAKLEAAGQRPFLGEGDSPCAHKSAFLGYMRKGETNDLAAFEKKSLSPVNDASGGYLIPRTMLDKIHGHMAVTSPMRALSRVTSISTDAYEHLIEKGEADVGWVAETADRPETGTPELMKLRIPVHQIYAKPRGSQKLLDDSTVDVEDWLAQKIADKMTLSENAAFVSGDGQGKPRGFMTYDLTPAGRGEWGKLECVLSGVAGGIPNADIILDAFYALKAQYLHGAKWVMSRTALAAIRKLKDKNGGYLWQPSLTGAAPGTLVGYPVVVADEMPALADGVESNSIVFGNFKEAYQIVDRAGLHILRDPFSAKPYVEFYATKRVGGDVINFDALKVIACAKG